jgi:VCBS repeat-containing protein
VIPAGWTETGTSPVIVNMTSGLAANADFFGQTEGTNSDPTADAGGPYLIQSGDDLTLSGAGSFDPDAGDLISYAWDIDNDGLFDDAVGVSPTLTTAELNTLGLTGGLYTIGLQVTDSFGASATDTASVRINRVPVADAGGPYTVQQGDDVTLSGAASTDPDAALGDSIISYAWDIDNDGEYDDKFGVSPTVTSAELAGFGMTNGAYTIGLQISDSFGGAGTDTATLTVLVDNGNHPPTANADLASAIASQARAINVVANDTDPDAGAVLSVDAASLPALSANGAALSVNGDGTVQYDPTNSAVLQALAANEPLDDTFSYTVKDQFGASSTATVTVHVTGVNNAPVAHNTAAATDEDTAIVITPDVTDVDHGAVISLTSVPAKSALGAVLTKNADGTIGYDPTAAAAIQKLAEGQTANDTFNYTVKDEFGRSSLAQITVLLTGKSDGVIAVDDVTSAAASTAKASASRAMRASSQPCSAAIAAATRPGATPSAATRRPAVRPSRVRRISTSATVRACSRRAA